MPVPFPAAVEGISALLIRHERLSQLLDRMVLRLTIDTLDRYQRVQRASDRAWDRLEGARQLLRAIDPTGASFTAALLHWQGHRANARNRQPVAA